MSRLPATASAQYVRDVLHLHEAPPPITIRYFYTSPLAIDDPLSPLPPPLTASATGYRSAPRPFSLYDNSALENAWLNVRKQLLKYVEQNSGEKLKSTAATSASRAVSQTQTLTVRNLAVGDSKGRSLAGSLGSQRAPESPRQTPQRVPSAEEIAGSRRTRARPATSGIHTSNPIYDLDPSGSSLPSESAFTTGNPFIRAPSRSNLRGPSRPRSSSRPVPQLSDSYNWGEDEAPLDGLEERAPQHEYVEAKAYGLTAKVPVGVSRLHNVVFPDLQYATQQS